MVGSDGTEARGVRGLGVTMRMVGVGASATATATTTTTTPTAQRDARLGGVVDLLGDVGQDLAKLIGRGDG